MATESRQLDLFFAFAGDVPFRDERESMSLPLLSLSKRKRIKPIEFSTRGGEVWCRVTAQREHGMATIYDFDVMLWCVSQLNEAVERGETPSRAIRFQPHDLLRSIRRPVGGEQYRRLEDTLRRLQSTSVETSVRADNRTQKAMFSWLDDWRHEVDTKTGRSKGMQVTVPRWLYDAVVEQRSVLAVPPEYFKLTGGIERWLYRLARRHAGKQPAGWRFRLRHLHERSGSLQAYGAFARDMRRVVQRNRLPEYALSLVSGKNDAEYVHMLYDATRALGPQRRDLDRSLMVS